MHTFPTALPLRVRKEAYQYFGIQIALASEIAIESIVRQARTGHDLVERVTLNAMPIEQLACAVDYVSLYRCAMTSGVRHDASCSLGAKVCFEKGFTRPRNIILKIFSGDAVMRGNG